MAAAARAHLVDTSDKLVLAWSRLHAVDADIVELPAHVDGTLLPEATTRSNQVANLAEAGAIKFLKAARALKAAAAHSEAAIAGTQEANDKVSVSAEASVQQAAQAAAQAAHADRAARDADRAATKKNRNQQRRQHVRHRPQLKQPKKLKQLRTKERN